METLGVRGTQEWEREIGARVALVRKNQALSQQELADRSNVSRSAIKYLESGRGSTLSTFIKVIRALGLDASLDQTFGILPSVSPMAVVMAKRKLSK